MIYQPRRGKAFVFEQIVESAVASESSSLMLTGRCLCLCIFDGRQPSIVKVLRHLAYFEPPPSLFTMDYEKLREAMLREILEAVRIPAEYWNDDDRHPHI